MIGKDELQNSFPASTFLQFCDSAADLVFHSSEMGEQRKMGRKERAKRMSSHLKKKRR